MPEAWIAQLLGPLGLVVGCLVAIWAFATERVYPRETVRFLREQNKELLRQNEALQRRLDRLVAVSGRLVEHVEKVELT